MNRLLDAFFWCLNNVEKSRKMLVTVVLLGLIVLIGGIVLYFVLGIPGVVERSVTGG